MIIQQLQFLANTNPHKLALQDDLWHLTYQELYKKVIGVAETYAQNIDRETGIVIINVKSMALKWVLILAFRSKGYSTVTVSDLNLLVDLKLSDVVALFHEGLTDDLILLLDKIVPDALIIKFSSSDLNNFEVPDDLVLDSRWGGHIEYTSGSTGNYKTVLRPGIETKLLIDRAISEFHITPESIFYFGSFHPGTAVGNKVPLACFYLGVTCIFSQRPSFIDGLGHSNADRTFITPVLVRDFLTITDAQKTLRKDLKIFCGGGFLDSALAMSIKSKLSCSIFINYAATECGVALQNEIHTEEDTVWISPIPSKTIKIFDEQLNEVEINREGFLSIQLEQCDPKSYMNDELTSHDSFHQGFFHTGDIAIKRADGKIRVIGREKNVINLGGDKKAVEPIEAMLNRSLGVNNVCVFSLQDESGLPSMTIVVEASTSPSDELLTGIARQFGDFFSKVNFHILPLFPVQLSGLMKVDRKEILKKINQENLLRTFNIKFKAKND
ncbi:AMP-binding protein [Candidatus Methylopumilus turicensis]|uniref:Putative o-succinylbenzoate--CoA ligase n=1 Tax=Candidatus Methylopumilus turicensis TaxID=1581680 RepID=A0A0B7J0C5_9PROT|nr:AMP-binding protein [Candidatus Methylopumilus turicensis]CEN56202.1 putative o-succinylbenzoate--CoA ligase [Candidatus Methylopumilus turicensis]